MKIIFVTFTALCIFLVNTRGNVEEPNRTIAADSLTEFAEDTGWCWYQDPRAVINKGKLIIGGIDGQTGDAKVGAYDLEARRSLGSVILHSRLQRDDYSAQSSDPDS